MGPTLTWCRAAVLPLWLGGTQHPHHGRVGGVGARREWLGQENVLVQWANPRCNPGPGGLEKASSAQEDEGLCREPCGTEQQLHSLPSQPLCLRWTSSSSQPRSLPGCPTPTPAAPRAELPGSGDPSSPRCRMAAGPWPTPVPQSMGLAWGPDTHVNHGPHPQGAPVLGRWVHQG